MADMYFKQLRLWIIIVSLNKAIDTRLMFNIFWLILFKSQIGNENIEKNIVQMVNLRITASIITKEIIKSCNRC